ncbi:MAG: K(+)-transporting ATPase subunit C [Candidatus Methylacidiphilales bacterium]|nr:K(+)-transporting ATPase subunit C [Candidatus Methylacidiphilales bacterium]
MKDLLSHLRGAVAVTLIFAVVLCGFYPVLIWGIAQAMFPYKANGSLIVDKTGTLRGSALLGQNFTGAQYFHPRPSAAGANGYDATSSGGSNLGPTSQKLMDQLKERVAAYRKENGLTDTAQIPADAVTASASGLDPHISRANAELQVQRVARARGVQPDALRQLVAASTDDGTFGILGKPGVNVVKLNAALDGLMH